MNGRRRVPVDENDRLLKLPERCWEVLTDHGGTLDRPVKLYCNTARRLSFVYAVLPELGNDDITFFEGSITPWSSYVSPAETLS